MKKAKALIILVLILSLAIFTIPVSAKAKKSEKINNYLTTSFDVYNVPIVNSLIEFNELMKEGGIKPSIEDNSGATNLYSIKAKANGCLIISSNAWITLLDTSTKNQQAIYAGSFEKTERGTYFITLRKNDKISIKTDTATTIYIAFLPESKIFNIDESYKDTNGTLQFRFGNVYENNTVLNVYAAKKKYSNKDILSGEVLAYKKTISYDYTSVADEQDALLTLPEAGEYTIVVKLTMNDQTIAYDTFILDTDKYIIPTLDIPEKPTAVISGTNLIVGIAEPAATVFVEYDGNEYQGKVDRYGVYRIVLKEDMKEGQQIKIWQTKNELSSKKGKYRVLAVEDY